MSATNTSVEASAIDAAYEERIHTLFMALATNLGDASASHQTEQQCVDKFKTGLNTAKKARQLAMTVVGVTPSA